MQARRAQTLRGEEIAEQRAVGEIDGKRTAEDIGAARHVVALQQLRRAGVLARRDGAADDASEIGGVAQAHVEALRTDRRDYMRGLADQRDAAFREMPGTLDRQRKQMASGFDAKTA